MREYGEFCGLARALDVVGERWTLLIIRELSLRPCRYTDLRDGLPGIATNLLADRLRALEAAGVVRAERPAPPVAGTVYALTGWGEQLRPVLATLARWSIPLMAPGPGTGEQRTRWLVVAVQALYGAADGDRLPTVSLRIDGADESVLVSASPTQVVATLTVPGTAADLVLRADPELAVAVLAGQVRVRDLDPAVLRGTAAARRRLARLTALGAEQAMSVVAVHQRATAQIS